MFQKSTGVIVAIVAIVVAFQACSKSSSSGNVQTVKNPSLPATPFNYLVSYPQHIAQVLIQQDNTPADNAITNEGAALGRVLFYDKQMSRNSTISCASCHKPDQSFSDLAVKSAGFNGGFTARHSMPVLNLRFYRSGRMFWDERAATLEEQTLMPIQDTTEMGMTLSDLVIRLKTLDYYPSLFQKAFGTTEINSERISKALAQFLRSMVTYQAKYDAVKSGTQNFTAEEAAGEQLFLTATGPNGGPTCAGCHRPPMFITSNPAGPFALLDPNDRGINNENRFKSSTLRNITAGGPLFHNGSVPSVEAMLASNIPAHGVPPQDRARILAFLRTLTDEVIVKDEKFGDPFK